MPVHRPEDMHKAFETAFNSGNAAAVMALYEPGAVLVGQTNAVGTAAIRTALDAFFAFNGKISIEARYAVTLGDLALTSGHWRLNGTGPDGKAVELQGKTAEVMRRQSDGSWLYVIDHPNGAE